MRRGVVICHCGSEERCVLGVICDDLADAASEDSADQDIRVENQLALGSD